MTHERLSERIKQGAERLAQRMDDGLKKIDQRFTNWLDNTFPLSEEEKELGQAFSDLGARFSRWCIDAWDFMTREPDKGRKNFLKMAGSVVGAAVLARARELVTPEARALGIEDRPTGIEHNVHWTTAQLDTRMLGLIGNYVNHTELIGLASKVEIFECGPKVEGTNKKRWKFVIQHINSIDASPYIYALPEVDPSDKNSMEAREAIKEAMGRFMYYMTVSEFDPKTHEYRTVPLDTSLFFKATTDKAWEEVQPYLKDSSQDPFTGDTKIYDKFTQLIGVDRNSETFDESEYQQKVDEIFLTQPRNAILGDPTIHDVLKKYPRSMFETPSDIPLEVMKMIIAAQSAIGNERVREARNVLQNFAHYMETDHYDRDGRIISHSDSTLLHAAWIPAWRDGMITGPNSEAQEIHDSNNRRAFNNAIPYLFGAREHDEVLIPEKVNDSTRNFLEQWSAEFIPLPKRPDKVRIAFYSYGFDENNQPIYGMRVLVQQNGRHNPYNGIRYDTYYAGSNDHPEQRVNAVQNLLRLLREGMITKLSLTDDVLEEIKYESDGATATEIKDVYEIDPTKLDAIYTPDSVIGTNNAAITFGLKLLRDDGKEIWVRLGDSFSETVAPDQVAVGPNALSFIDPGMTWYSDRTDEINALIDRGITEVHKFGLYDPRSAWTYFLLKHLQNQNMPLAHLMPDDEILRAFLLSNYFESVLAGDGTPLIKSIVALENVVVQQATISNAGLLAPIAPDIEKFLGIPVDPVAQSSITIRDAWNPQTGEKVILRKGEMYLVFNDIIADVNGNRCLMLFDPSRLRQLYPNQSAPQSFQQFVDDLRRGLIEDVRSGIYVIQLTGAGNQRDAIAALDPRSIPVKVGEEVLQFLELELLLLSMIYPGTATAIFGKFTEITSWPFKTALKSLGGEMGVDLVKAWSFIDKDIIAQVIKSIKILPFAPPPSNRKLADILERLQNTGSTLARTNSVVPSVPGVAQNIAPPTAYASLVSPIVVSPNLRATAQRVGRYAWKEFDANTELTSTLSEIRDRIRQLQEENN